jgi:predicted methyltransferase
MGRDVLVIGDDLSPAVAVALLGKALSPSGRLARRVVALHYDERRLRHLRDIAQAEGVLIGLVTYNLQRALPEDLQGEFSTVWVSPPTHDALPLYLSRAVEAAVPDGGRILLLIESNSPDQQLEAQRAIAEMGLLIQGLSIEPGDNRSFYSLAVTEETLPLIEGDYTNAL